MKDTKLNNLLGMEQYSDAEFMKKTKTTKRTDVAKDVLQENAYVLGKDVLGDKLKNKETHAAKGLNNLISLDDFTKEVPKTSAKGTKRTDVAKDILMEKKKAEFMKAKKAEMKKKDEDDKKGGKDEKGKTGLTAAQKKLPEAFQKAILKKQGK